MCNINFFGGYVHVCVCISRQDKISFLYFYVCESYNTNKYIVIT